MRTKTVVREAKAVGALAVGAAERAVDAAAQQAAVEIQLNLEDLEDSAEEGRADLDRRITNIESQDSARRRAEQEGEKQRASIAIPGVQK
jgi:hypothetical protein